MNFTIDNVKMKIERKEITNKDRAMVEQLKSNEENIIKISRNFGVVDREAIERLKVVNYILDNI